MNDRPTASTINDTQLDDLHDALDGAYRERAHLVALLAALYPAHIGYTDPNAVDWLVVTIETPTGQMSWHIAERDRDLFEHVRLVPAVHNVWDGHTTEEKYTRLRRLTASPGRAEAAIARVRAKVADWREWNEEETSWAVRDIENAIANTPPPQPEDPAALDEPAPVSGPAATQATEVVDLVDEHGTPHLTGIPRNQAEQHPGLYLPIILVVITHTDGRILIHQRAATKSQPYALDHVCGAIRSGETPDEAARRETGEETGAVLTSLRLVHAGVNEHGRYRHLYAGTTATPERELAGDPEEVEWIGYATADQLRCDSRAFVKGFFEDLDAATQVTEEQH